MSQSQACSELLSVSKKLASQVAEGEDPVAKRRKCGKRHATRPPIRSKLSPSHTSPSSGRNPPRIGCAASIGSIKKFKRNVYPHLGAKPIDEIKKSSIKGMLDGQGIDYLGPLPAEVQFITVFSAGLHAAAPAPDAARALLKFLTAPDAAPVLKHHGMEPG